ARWLRSPERAVHRVREVDDRTSDGAEHDRANVCHVLNRVVLDDGVVVVVDERIAERVEIHDPTQQRRDATCDERPYVVISIHASNTQLSLGTRPLRILHVTPYSPDAWAYGGRSEERRVGKECRARWTL